MCSLHFLRLLQQFWNFRTVITLFLVVHSCKNFISKTCPKIECKSQNLVATLNCYKVIKLTRTRNFLTENVSSGRTATSRLYARASIEAQGLLFGSSDQCLPCLLPYPLSSVGQGHSSDFFCPSVHVWPSERGQADTKLHYQWSSFIWLYLTDICSMASKEVNNNVEKISEDLLVCYNFFVKLWNQLLVYFCSSFFLKVFTTKMLIL